MTPANPVTGIINAKTSRLSMDLLSRDIFSRSPRTRRTKCDPANFGSESVRDQCTPSRKRA